MTRSPSVVNIARECLQYPRRRAVWIESLGRYVCPDSDDGKLAIEGAGSLRAPSGSGINPQFKLVFLTAAGGTLLFILLCVAISIISGREPPPLWEKLAMSFFDLGKIGFGAVVGLLGGQKLQAEEGSSSSPA